MIYDTIQIERMESGGHRIKVRNEKQSRRVLTRDGGPEALDIVINVFWRALRLLQNFTEYPPPSAPECTVPSDANALFHELEMMRKRIETLERSDKVVSDFIIENGNRIAALETRVKVLDLSDSLSDALVLELEMLRKRIGNLETLTHATQTQYELDFGRLRDAFTNATETMREPKGGDA